MAVADQAGLASQEALAVEVEILQLSDQELAAREMLAAAVKAATQVVEAAVAVQVLLVLLDQVRMAVMVAQELHHQ